MKTLFINGLKFTFDKVIDFEQRGENLFECFFFKGDEIVTSKFLTLFELNQIKKQNGIELA